MRDFIFKHHRYSESHQWTKTLVLLYNEHSVLNSPSLSSWDYTVWRTKGDSASFELIIIESITLISFNGYGAITELLKHISWNHHSLSENLQQNHIFKARSKNLWLFWQNQAIASKPFYPCSKSNNALRSYKIINATYHSLDNTSKKFTVTVKKYIVTK